jgi:hypothetical protein
MEATCSSEKSTDTALYPRIHIWLRVFTRMCVYCLRIHAASNSDSAALNTDLISEQLIRKEMVVTEYEIL